MAIDLESFSLGGLVGVFIGALANHYLAKQRDNDSRKSKEFNEAATQFRAAFKDEILALDPALSTCQFDTSDLLENAFDKHRAAVAEFKQVLNDNDSHKFEIAWQEYYRYEHAPDVAIHGLAQYTGNGCSVIVAKERKCLAANRIRKLLNFAQNR